MARVAAVFLLAAVALLASGAGAAEPDLPRATANGFSARRGTNISHWLSQSDRRGEERRRFFTEEDVELIKRLGYDHIRLPVDEEQLWDEGGRPEEEAFALLDAALDWSAARDLRVIVDLHILRSHHFNRDDKPLWTDPREQERFLDLWRRLSARLEDRPNDRVAYELMNEPVADDPEEWNQLVARAIDVVRELEPERTLVVGSNRWQSAETFDQLRIPAGDPNILLSFHLYTPMALTHYGASWTKVGEYDGPVRYPGEVVTEAALEELPDDLADAVRDGRGLHFDRSVLEAIARKPLALARTLDLPLYCGEWGALPSAPRADRLRWYRDVRDVLEAHAIGWAHWDYKGGFGVVDGERTIHLDLAHVLLGGDFPRTSFDPAGHQPAEEEAVLAVMDAYMHEISANDLDAMDARQTPDGMTYRVSAREDGSWDVVGRPNSYWVAPERADSHSYRERYWSPTVLVRGVMALVWAPYEFQIDGRTTHCGVDVFSYAKIDGVWKVSNSMWTVEPDACPELWPRDPGVIRPRDKVSNVAQ